jgi:hypothetical protein
MARLFSNIEYIDTCVCTVLVYGETCGSASRPQRISERLLLVGTSIPIDTMEVLREQVGNAATTIRNFIIIAIVKITKQCVFVHDVTTLLRLSALVNANIRHLRMF